MMNTVSDPDSELSSSEDSVSARLQLAGLGVSQLLLSPPEQTRRCGQCGVSTEEHGQGLRTDLRAKTKAKYSGKDQLYDSMRGKSRKMKRCNTNQQRFKNLTHLDLHGCRKLGDKNLENLLQYFHQLEIIRLGRIPAISDRTMTAVAQHCRHLRHLDISHCCLVSSSGLFTVIKHCTKLGTLELDKTF